MVDVEIVESIVKQTLADERDILAQMEAGTHRAPWANDAQHAAAIEECKARIASMQHKLDDRALLIEWWNSVPSEVRATWINT